jgi:hypothetical protein
MILIGGLDESESLLPFVTNKGIRSDVVLVIVSPHPTSYGVISMSLVAHALAQRATGELMFLSLR